jgi:hypothetical protein
VIHRELLHLAEKNYNVHSKGTCRHGAGQREFFKHTLLLNHRFWEEKLSKVFGQNLDDDIIVEILHRETIDSFSPTKAVESCIRKPRGDTYIEGTCEYS